MSTLTPDERERLETELLALRHKFTVCWMVAMPQLIAGWATLGGGIAHWSDTGEFMSFRMVFGIMMMLFFGATFLYTRPVYLKMVELRGRLKTEAE